MNLPVRRTVAAVMATVAGLFVTFLGTPAEAHGFTSVVYADLTGGASGHVTAVLGLEYDLLVVSAADAEKDDAFFKEGTPAWDAGDRPGMVKAVEDHRAAVLAYVADRFTITADGRTCTPTIEGAPRMKTRQQVPYAFFTVDYACGVRAGEHEVTSTLFPASEEYVKSTKTIVTYDLDLVDGSAALDAQHPSFDTHQSTGERFWEFFHLGAEHLYTGLDHILFLIALIAGSRRLREVVLAATSFTLAHSVTFILAALGLVDVPAGIVEPVIALSIAAVAAWHLWRLWRYRGHAGDLETAGTSHFALDRAGWTRLGVVFCFGLVHGLGFAGALGIDQAFSWTLLWSLLVFNVGIESVQLVVIAVVFPLLVLLRRTAPTVGLWVTGIVAAGVAVMGLIWFAERV